MKKEQEEMHQNKKKYSIFQITSFVLIVVLLIAIIIQIGIIINLNNNINNLKDKNSQLPEISEEKILENDFYIDF